MSRILIADAGSTKTQWCLIGKNRRPVYRSTSGLNPYLQTPEDIARVLREELRWDAKKHSADSIMFYGAGATGRIQQGRMSKALKQFFGVAKTEVQGDMLAAARAVCGHGKGIVCILGTGSNSCYYDGKKIARQQASLGYIAGDEGSGNHMGRRVLQYYAYHTFDEDLRAQFEALFGADMDAILEQLYHAPFPNRYLAGFVKLLADNRGHFMVENIIEDCLSDFFQQHILRYRQSWKLPIHFCGSVAHEFRDVLTSLCEQYELEPGKVVQRPLEGLMAYHKALL